MWMYGYDVKTKIQSSHRMRKGSPRSKQNKKSVKDEGDVDCIFFYLKGIAHHEFVPRGHTVNQQLYQNVNACEGCCAHEEA